MNGTSLIVASALVAGLVHASSLGAGELRWGGKPLPRESFRTGQSSPAEAGSHQGWHSGRHHGTHEGLHHDRHHRSHSFEHRQGFRFHGRTHGFSFGLHAHESGSGSSFGAAGPPPWGAAGPSPFAAGRAPVVFISTPFFCYPHGLGFTSEAELVEHLVEVHGLAEQSALAACRPVGGKLFFFGF